MDTETLKEMGKRYPLMGPMLDITFKVQGINTLEYLWKNKGTASVIFAIEYLKI
jgi:hypothetical protein